MGTVSRRGLFAVRASQAPAAPSAPAWLHVHRSAMACRFEITLPAEIPNALPAATAALDEVDRLEAQLSIFRSTSEISAINREAATRPVHLEAGLFGLLQACAQLHRETDGAFDITTAPLTRCWGFMRRQGRVPDAAALAQARAQVGMESVALDQTARSIRFARRGLELNLAAVGKGYALDVVASGLRRRVGAALLNGGSSSMVAIGQPPGLPGWKVGIRDPRRRDTRAAVLALRDAAMATSGVGEQAFVADGRRYSHLLDPRTGQPVEGILSVTVVASSGTQAEALSTAFAVGGVALAARYCDEHPDVLAFMFLESEECPVTIGAHPGCHVSAVRER